MTAQHAHLPAHWARPSDLDLSAARVRHALDLADGDAPAFELQMAIAQAWGAGFVKPSAQLPRDRWAALFRRAGYFTLADLPRPTEPIRLYRGAADGWERGMSWTTSPALARRFDNALWTILAPPATVLATFATMERDGNGNAIPEYVVDVSDDLAVEETSAPGHGGRVLEFRGRTVEAVERNVRRFLADSNLSGLRPSALGCTVLHPRRKHTLAAVEFSGYPQVINEAVRRHRIWFD
jgi:hypothetical protein